MKFKIVLLIAIFFGLNIPVFSQVTPGSVVEESIDSFLATPASNYSAEIPVVVIRYLPTLDGVNIDVAQATDYWSLGYITLNALKSNIDNYDKRTKFSLEQGTKYHGYKDSNANPYLGYKVLKYLTVYRQVQPGAGIGQEGGVNLYQPDYKKEFDDLNLTNFIRDNHVKEVWLWYGEPARPNWPSYNAAIHSGITKSVSFVESNMSSPSTGDISNSSRIPNDLYIFDYTYVVYCYNFRRSQAEAVHNHGHQLECLYKYANWRQDGNYNLFLKDFSGWPNGNYTVPPIGRVGDCHHPPNTGVDYDYLNTTLIESDIEDWKPAGGAKKPVNVNTWGNLVYNWPGASSFMQKSESQWYLYWMQNMPGNNCFIPYNSRVISNWWKFTADWDYCITNNIGLHEALSQLPATAGTITGNNNVCKGQNAVVYTVPPIAYSTSYIWTLPTGATGTSSTNSITVDYGAAAVSGDITVKGNNALGDGVPSLLAINVTPTLGTAGSISGNATACQGQNNVSYSVPIMVGASSYIWTLPAGATGSSSTNTILVNYGVSAASGNISVKGTNSCGDGTASTLAISVNQLPSSPGTISGATSVCSGQNLVTYTVPPIPGATSYVWTLPTGASGSSVTNSISVNYNLAAVSGNITVKGTNTCGDGSASVLPITVIVLPSDAGAISGVTTACQGLNSVIYSVALIPNASSYIWTLPGGASGSSSSNSISVNYSSSAVSGAITVKGTNSCGDGISSTLLVTIQPKPESAGIISGATSVCQGQNYVTYSVATIMDANSYSWILPNGVTGFSNTRSIEVNYSKTAITGNISVFGVNTCGEGPQSSLPITINKLPADAGAISGETKVCHGQNSVVYNVASIPDATSYIWTLPTGATGSSATNSITVNYGISAVSGNITVKGINSCGEGTSSVTAINVSSIPPDPFITLNGAKLHSSAATGNQWYNQNGMITGATDQDYTITADGSYYVKVVVDGCSSNPSNTIIISHTGLNSSEPDKTISVYPNPVKDQITIELIGYKKRTSFEILNSLNQLVYKGFIDGKTVLTTSGLSGGIYIIKLENGKVVKFIK